MTTLRGAAALGILALVAASGLTADVAAAGKGRRARTMPLGDVPPWIREAHARVVPPTDAGVVWLHDETIVERSERWGLLLTRRVAARVLREGGLDDVASFAVYYNEGDEVRDPLRAWTIQPDETVVLPDPEDDVRDDPAIGGALVFNDVRVRRIFSRSATVGSVVAFETQRIKRLDLGSEGFAFGAVDAPTAFSRFTLKVPDGWTWDRVGLRDDGLEIETGPNGFTAIARDLPPLKDEEFAPPARDRMPRVWARWRDPAGEVGFEDWAAFNAWFRDLAEPTLEEPGEAAEIGARLRPAGPEELLDALSKAYAFAAREIRYVSIDIGLGIGAGFKPDTPKQICDKRYGDCKDKSFLMRALTRPWQVESFPVLVRTRGLGELAEAVPGPQFNHCIVAVKLPDGIGESLWSTATVEGVGRVVFLDATVRRGSPWALRSDVQGTRAFLVHPGGGTLVDLPVQPPEAAVREIEFQAALQPDGTLREATLQESWSGTQATAVRRFYSGLTEEQRRRRVEEDLNARISGARIADYSIEGLEEMDAPVVERTGLSSGRVAQHVGNLLIVGSESIVGGFADLSLPKPPRTWPFVLSNPWETRVRLRLELPAGWAPEEIPLPVDVDHALFDAHAAWSVEDGALVFERRLRMRQMSVAPDDYPAFRESLLQVAAADRQSIVLVEE